jgi:hypothetical protein
MAEVSDQQLAQLGVKLERISIRVSSFGSSLATISNQLSQASSLERMKEKQEQDRERILAEQALREGKESVFERKMQNALVAPMQKVAGPAMNALARLQNFFLALGASWLTGRIFNAIKAAQEGNKSKLEEIKGNILTGLRRVLLVFTLARFGISRAIRAIIGVGGAIMNGIYTGLIRKPFVALMNAIRRASASAANTVGRLFGRAPRSPLPRQPQPRTPGRPGQPGRPGRPGGGPGGRGIFGGLFNGISAFMNLKNGEYMDTAVLAMSVFGPGKLVRGLMSIGYIADDISEAFGTNIFGKDPNAAAVREEVEKQKTSTADTSSNVQPTDNLMGGSSTDSSKEDGVEANTSQANFQSEDSTQPADVSPSGSQEPPAAQISSSSSSSTSSSQVGPTPKPEPQVNIIPQSSNPQSVPAEGGAQASKIPNIPSSNIDNFYTLYSQVNYNVVT